MKKALVTALAFASLAVYQARATIDLGVSVGEIQDSSGNPTTGGAIAILVADTSGTGAMATLGNNLSPGSTMTNGGFIQNLAAANVGFIIGKFTINQSSGTDGLLLDDTGSVNLVSPLAANQLLYLLWFPTLTTSSLTPGNSTSYGIFRDPGSPPADGNQDWVVPADGQTVTIGAFTAVYGGSTLQALLQAAQETAAVPEPSSMMLIGVGLLGLVGFVRRRR